jgi:hypothetical protein
METDGHDAERAVAPGVSQVRRALRLQQLPCYRVSKQTNVSLLGWHHCHLSFRGSTLLTRERALHVSISMAESSEAGIAGTVHYNGSPARCRSSAAEVGQAQMLSSYQLLDRCQMGGSGRCECAVYFEHLSQAHEIGQFVDIK